MKYIQFNFNEILTHEQLYKCPFAKRGRYSVGFGKSRPNVDNPTEIQWSFVAPDRVVNEVSYASGSYVTNGGFVLIISDHANAEPDDNGVVGYVEVMNGRPARRVSMFVNSVPVDPQPPKDFVSGEPEPRDTWLECGKKYYGRLYRTDILASGVHPPLALDATSY